MSSAVNREPWGGPFPQMDFVFDGWIYRIKDLGLDVAEGYT